MQQTKLFLSIRNLIVFLMVGWSSHAQPEQPLSGLNLEHFDKADKAAVKWNDNPFTQPVDDVSVPSLRLLAIVHHPSDSAALVNRQVVRVGDKIGSSEVVSILPQEVVLRANSGVFKLNFENRKK